MARASEDALRARLEPLPEIPWLDGAFVRSDLETVAARFRGELASVAHNEGTGQYEVSGTAARIDIHPFGPELDSPMPPEAADRIAAQFPLRGFARVSRVRCAPDWVFVEGPMGVAVDQLVLDDLVGAPCLAIWSGLFSAPYFPSAGAGTAMDGFSYHADGAAVRSVEYCADASLRGKRFTTWGAVQSFETPAHYKARATADRMTRAILFDCLAALGLDAVSVFARRELDDPLLYTSDHPGLSCHVYVADRRRYRAWGENLAAGPA